MALNTYLQRMFLFLIISIDFQHDVLKKTCLICGNQMTFNILIFRLLSFNDKVKFFNRAWPLMVTFSGVCLSFAVFFNSPANLLNKYLICSSPNHSWTWNLGCVIPSSSTIESRKKKHSLIHEVVTRWRNISTNSSFNPLEPFEGHKN